MPACMLLAFALVSLAVGDARAGGPERIDSQSRTPPVSVELTAHVRPQGFVAQMEHCRALLDRGEPPGVFTSCLRHAAGLIEQGLRLRERSGAAGSTGFERRLESGAREIAAALEALPTGDRARLQRELSEIERQIASLRAELSRIAASEHVTLSLVSRGGVSLGSWQAGFLYAVTEWAKLRAGRTAQDAVWEPAFSTVTGASAGAVNGLVAAVEGCRGPTAVPRDSLYYKVWIDLGLFGRHGRAGLLAEDGSGSSALGLFSDQALRKTLAEAEAAIRSERRLPACNVDFGFVATHLDRTTSPIQVDEGGEAILTTKKLKEKFTVRLSFPAFRSAAPADESGPRITNIGPPEALRGDRVYYAALGHTADVPLGALLLGVQASAAFPGAFPPVALTYTQYVPGPDDTVVARKRAATFIDGGILDNTPVGLAVGLDAWRDDEPVRDPYFEGLVPERPRTYVFLEPEVRSWPRGSGEGAAARAHNQDLLQVFLGFTGDLLETSMDAQLSNTAEQYPFVRRESNDWTQPRLSVPRRHMPITGEQFYHFLAFLERDFRNFDFYVGMADAHEYLEAEECRAAPDAASCIRAGTLAQLDEELQAADSFYRCIRAYYSSDAFRVLKRTSVDQLPMQCRELAAPVCEGGDWPVDAESVKEFLRSGAIADEGKQDRCIEPSIENHNFRTLLAAMHNYKVWMQSGDYSEAQELDRFVAELASEDGGKRFVYVDLPTYQHSDDGTMDADEVKRAFRSLMQDGLERLATQQKGPSKVALRLGGRAAADIAYQRDYPEQIIGVGIVLNGVEGVFGQRLATSAWRWDSALRVFRIRQETYAAGLDPWTTEFYLSTQATRIFSPTRYIDAEIGAGWAASETVAYSASSPGHVAFRSGPRAFLALVAVQRIYAAVNVDYYPVLELAPAYRNAINPVVTEWQWNLAGGWRFLF